MKWSKFNIKIPFDNDRTILFNTLSRNIVLVQNKALQTIKESMDKANINANYLDDMSQLKSLNFIIPDPIDENSRFVYLMSMHKFNSSSISIFISLSSECNFRCVYCYQDADNAKNNAYMNEKNWKILFNYIDYRRKLSGLKSIALILFGGEPMMNDELVKKIIKDVGTFKKAGCTISIALITNGSLLTPDKIDEIGQFLNTIQFTIDGNEESHDELRLFSNGAGSYKIVLENFLYAVKKIPGKVVLRCNVSNTNKKNIIALLRLLASFRLQNLIREVDFRAIYSSQREITQCGRETKITVDTATEVAEIFLEASKLGFEVSRSFVVGPCSGTMSNSFAVDENLNVYVCPGFLYLNPDGKIDKNGKLSISNSRWYKMCIKTKPCVYECKYGPICYGGCRWMEGTSTKCNKEIFEATLPPMLKAYVLSKIMRGLDVR